MDSKNKTIPIKIYKLAFASLFLCFSCDQSSSERKTYFLTLLGKIEEDIAINPPTKKIIPESRSNIIEKKPSFTNVNALTLKNNDKNGNNITLITKKARLTFKTQVTDRRKLQGITIINNVITDLFISLPSTEDYRHLIYRAHT